MALFWPRPWLPKLETKMTKERREELKYEVDKPEMVKVTKKRKGTGSNVPLELIVVWLQVSRDSLNREATFTISKKCPAG